MQQKAFHTCERNGWRGTGDAKPDLERGRGRRDWSRTNSLTALSSFQAAAKKLDRSPGRAAACETRHAFERGLHIVKQCILLEVTPNWPKLHLICAAFMQQERLSKEDASLQINYPGCKSSIKS